jgi:hypothetical protein
VADKNNPWRRAHPFNQDVVTVPEGFDYLLLLQQNDRTFSTQGASIDDMAVREIEIRLLHD